jgi:hypothetical protein
MSMPHNENAPQMTMGEAAKVLASADLRSHQHEKVEAFAVGLRDSQTAFVLKVSDRTAKDELSAKYRDQTVQGLPVHVELGSYAAASCPVQTYSVASQVAMQPESVLSRLGMVVRNLASLFRA